MTHDSEYIHLGRECYIMKCINFFKGKEILFNTNININSDNVYRHESGSNNYEKHMVLSGSGNEINEGKYHRETKEAKEESAPPPSSDGTPSSGKNHGALTDETREKVTSSIISTFVSWLLGSFFG